MSSCSVDIMSSEDADIENVDETVHDAVVAAAKAAGNAFPDDVGDTGDGEEEIPPPQAKRRRIVGRRNQHPWNDMLFDLLKYRQMNGNLMVPFKSGGELGKWVASQRAQYLALQKMLAGEDSSKWQIDGPERLTEERMKVLSSIGFVWDVVQADNDARWKKRFDELKEYRAMHGHVRSLYILAAKAITRLE